MKKSIFFLLPLIFCSFLIPSCIRKEQKLHPTIIGVALSSRNTLFSREFEEGLRAEAAKQKYILAVASAEMDLGRQIAQIEELVARKVDAIIICPVDAKGVGGGIRKANESGVPVFTASVAALDGDVVSHIVSNDELGGAKAGEYLAKALHGKGNIMIVDQPGDSVCAARVAGLKKSLEKYPGMKIAGTVNGEGNRDHSLRVVLDMVDGHPEMDAIFSVNDDSALGALDALGQRGRTTILVGCGGTLSAIDAVSRGTSFKAEVVQYPKRIGMAAISAIKDYRAGVPVQKRILVDVGIVDQESLRNSTAH